MKFSRQEAAYHSQDFDLAIQLGRNNTCLMVAVFRAAAERRACDSAWLDDDASRQEDREHKYKQITHIEGGAKLLC